MSQPDDDTGPMVGDDALRAALEQTLSDHLGAQCRITMLDRRPSSYRSSFALEELDVRLDTGTCLQLMFKHVGRQGLLARAVKPAFLCDPLREIETYRTILAPSRLGAATCYGAVVDQHAGRYWLFLERVPGLELYRHGLPVWRQVAGWVAVMHARFAREDVLPTLAQSPHLLTYNGDFYRLWLRRAQAFMRKAEPSRSRKARHRLEWLAARYDQVIDRLLALPTTFIHGEFYASNVLVQEAAGELRVCPVDWEMAAIGPGLIDLAALTAGTWIEEEKQSLTLAYHAALAPTRGWPPEPDAFLTALDCCQLHLALQWLGWAPAWSPPPDQAQDWLNEALHLAEKLEL